MWDSCVSSCTQVCSVMTQVSCVQPCVMRQVVPECYERRDETSEKETAVSSMAGIKWTKATLRKVSSVCPGVFS